MFQLAGEQFACTPLEGYVEWPVCFSTPIPGRCILRVRCHARVLGIGVVALKYTVVIEESEEGFWGLVRESGDE
jgi:hypothetical protein